MPSSEVPNYAIALGVIAVLVLIIGLVHSNRRLRSENKLLRQDHLALLRRAVVAERALEIEMKKR